MALDQLIEGQAEAATVVNENFIAVEPASAYGRCASTTNLLTWGYYGGNTMLGGTLTTVAAGTVSLTASNTNYIQAHPTTGAVSANTSGFTAGYLKLYTAVCDGTTVTGYTDYRFAYGLFNSVSQMPQFMGALVKFSTDPTAQNLSSWPYTPAWDAESYDTHGFHSTVTNNSRLTIPSGYGITRVRLAAQLRMTSMTTAGPFNVSIFKNGSIMDGGAVQILQTGTTWSLASSNVVTAVVDCVDGDYFEVKAEYDADTSVSLTATDSWFSIEAVEATRLDQHRSLFTTIASSSGALTMSLTAYEYFKTTLTENVTSVTVSGLTSGQVNRFELRVAQDATGGRTWANPANWQFPGGTAYTPSAAASAVDILRGRTYDDGTTWEVEFNKGYA